MLGTIDDSKMISTNQRLLRGADAGSAAVAAHLAAGVALIIADRSPIDTGRYVAAWQQAHNKLPGVSPVVVTPLKPSRFFAKAEVRIQKQLTRWEPVLTLWQERVTAMERHPNHKRWISYRKTVKTRDKVLKIVERAREELQAIRGQEGQTAIVIGGRKTGGALTLGRLARVVTRFYGGDARMVQVGPGVWVAEVKNLEPHARIVAKRTGLVRAAIRVVRAIEKQPASRKFLARVREAAGAGLTVRGGSYGR